MSAPASPPRFPVMTGPIRVPRGADELSPVSATRLGGVEHTVARVRSKTRAQIEKPARASAPPATQLQGKGITLTASSASTGGRQLQGVPPIHVHINMPSDLAAWLNGSITAGAAGGVVPVLGSEKQHPSQSTGEKAITALDGSIQQQRESAVRPPQLVAIPIAVPARVRYQQQQQQLTNGRPSSAPAAVREVGENVTASTGVTSGLRSRSVPRTVPVQVGYTQPAKVFDGASSLRETQSPPQLRIDTRVSPVNSMPHGALSASPHSAPLDQLAPALPSGSADAAALSALVSTMWRDVMGLLSAATATATATAAAGATRLGPLAEVQPRSEGAAAAGASAGVTRAAASPVFTQPQQQQQQQPARTSAATQPSPRYASSGSQATTPPFRDSSSQSATSAGHATTVTDAATQALAPADAATSPSTTLSPHRPSVPTAAPPSAALLGGDEAALARLQSSVDALQRQLGEYSVSLSGAIDETRSELGGKLDAVNASTASAASLAAAGFGGGNTLPSSGVGSVGIDAVSLRAAVHLGAASAVVSEVVPSLALLASEVRSIRGTLAQPAATGSIYGALPQAPPHPAAPAPSPRSVANASMAAVDGHLSSLAVEGRLSSLAQGIASLTSHVQGLVDAVGLASTAVSGAPRAAGEAPAAGSRPTSADSAASLIPRRMDASHPFSSVRPTSAPSDAGGWSEGEVGHRNPRSLTPGGASAPPTAAAAARSSALARIAATSGSSLVLQSLGALQAGFFAGSGGGSADGGGPARCALSPGEVRPAKEDRPLSPGEVPPWALAALRSRQPRAAHAMGVSHAGEVSPSGAASSQQQGSGTNSSGVSPSSTASSSAQPASTGGGPWDFVVADPGASPASATTGSSAAPASFEIRHGEAQAPSQRRFTARKPHRERPGALLQRRPSSAGVTDAPRSTGVGTYESRPGVVNSQSSRPGTADSASSGGHGRVGAGARPSASLRPDSPGQVHIAHQRSLAWVKTLRR